MERQDYTSLQSHYIPNERTYHFIFPISILEKYNGADNLDVTLDDNLTYIIIEPILRSKIEYRFELIWNDENADRFKNTVAICVKVNDQKFDFKLVIDHLKQAKMITGLELFKEAYDKWIKIF